MKFEGSVVVRKRQWVGRLKQESKMTAVLLIVGLDGYDHNYYKREPDRWGSTTSGYNVHLSMNGPMQLTFDEAEEFRTALGEAIETAKFELGEHHFGI